MANSFGDQFLKAGLVNKTQLNKAQKSKNKQQKLKQKQKIEVVDEAAVAAQQAAAEKAARDRELNRQQKEEAERKAVQAQVRQLIEMNRLPRNDGDVGYNFEDGIVVTESAAQRLVAAQACATGERDLEQLARGEDALVGHRADQHLCAPVAAPRVAADPGAFNP